MRSANRYIPTIRLINHGDAIVAKDLDDFVDEEQALDVIQNSWDEMAGQLPDKNTSAFDALGKRAIDLEYDWTEQVGTHHPMPTVVREALNLCRGRHHLQPSTYGCHP